MPVPLIGHGPPVSAVLNNSFTRSLRVLEEALPRSQTVLIHLLSTADLLAQEPDLDSNRPQSDTPGLFR